MNDASNRLDLLGNWTTYPQLRCPFLAAMSCNSNPYPLDFLPGSIPTSGVCRSMLPMSDALGVSVDQMVRPILDNPQRANRFRVSVLISTLSAYRDAAGSKPAG